jgi:hypothetical protein
MQRKPDSPAFNPEVGITRAGIEFALTQTFPQSLFADSLGAILKVVVTCCSRLHQIDATTVTCTSLLPSQLWVDLS